jgi:hypothetical protein
MIFKNYNNSTKLKERIENNEMKIAGAITTREAKFGPIMYRYCVKSQPTNSPLDSVFYCKYFKESRQQYIRSYLYT